MAECWFAIVTLLVTGYAVLDGFDLGAGVLHAFVAREDRERREIFSAIGPFWDGNEVFLIATGGALFLSFPKVLAALLSGLYLAVFLFLWLLIGRGISIEFRNHIRNPLWRSFWDFWFGVSSAGLCILLGAAVANVVRGVPLDPKGQFSLPLFDSFSPFGDLGILDWYTVAGGLFSLLLLTLQGATFLAWKTTGPVHDRSIRTARRVFAFVPPAWIILTLMTLVVRPDLRAELLLRPLPWLAIGGGVGALCAIFHGLRSGRSLLSFLGSSGFLVSLALATSTLSFPILLFAPRTPEASLDTRTAATSNPGLLAGLAWWWMAALLAGAYFFLLFRLNRGKVDLAVASDEGSSGI